MKSGLPLSVLFAYSAPRSDSDREESAAASPSFYQQRQASSDGSDVGEDNSDVGYHSDQSLDKTGLNDPSPLLSKNSRVVEFQSVSVENPNYEAVTVKRNRKSGLAPFELEKRMKIFRRQYADTVSTSEDLPESSKSAKICCDGRRRSGSFTIISTKTNTADSSTVPSSQLGNQFTNRDVASSSVSHVRFDLAYDTEECALKNTHKRSYNKSAGRSLSSSKKVDKPLPSEISGKFISITFVLVHNKFVLKVFFECTLPIRVV